MRPHMNFEPSSARICLTANFALEWFIASMDELVRFKVAFCDETLSTVVIRADIRPFSSLYRDRISLGRNFVIKLTCLRMCVLRFPVS